MRDLGDVPAAVFAGAFTWSCQVASWRDGVLLAAEVPVLSGTLSVDGSRQVPESLEIVVPERGSDGSRLRSWVPGSDAYHPLARYGQVLDVVLTVTSSVTGASGSVSLGRYQIQDWDHDDLAHQVRVSAVGLLQRPSDARFHRPEAPRSGGTFGSEIARLAGGMPVEIDGGLIDRLVPLSFTWDEDRLAALYDLADAWPARLRVDPLGVLQVLPPLPETPQPVLTFADGARGTLISAPTSDTRDGIPNVIVYRGQDTDDPARSPIMAEAAVLGGPLKPAGYGEVVEFFSSPLVTTYGQAQAAVNTRLANATRGARQRVITCVPDPRVELDDGVDVLTGARVRTSGARGVTYLDGGAPGEDASYVDGGAPGEDATYLEGGTPADPLPTAATRVWDTRESGWVVGYDLPLVVASDSDRMTVRVGVS